MAVQDHAGSGVAFSKPRIGPSLSKRCIVIFVKSRVGDMSAMAPLDQMSSHREITSGLCGVHAELGRFGS